MLLCPPPSLSMSRPPSLPPANHHSKYMGAGSTLSRCYGSLRVSGRSGHSRPTSPPSVTRFGYLGRHQYNSWSLPFDGAGACEHKDCERAVVLSTADYLPSCAHCSRTSSILVHVAGPWCQQIHCTDTSPNNLPPQLSQRRERLRIVNIHAFDLNTLIPYPLVQTVSIKVPFSYYSTHVHTHTGLHHPTYSGSSFTRGPVALAVLSPVCASAAEYLQNLIIYYCKQIICTSMQWNFELQDMRTLYRKLQDTTTIIQGVYNTRSR